MSNKEMPLRRPHQTAAAPDIVAHAPLDPAWSGLNRPWATHRRHDLTILRKVRTVQPDA